MTDGLITYEEAIGAPPMPSDDATSNPYGDHVITVTRSPRATPSHVISYEDATAGYTPNPGGAISNATGGFL